MDVQNGKSSYLAEENDQSMQEEVNALNFKLSSSRAKAVALCLDVESIQISLSSAKTALESRCADLVRYGTKNGELMQLYKSEKAMRLQSLYFADTEYRSKVQLLLNRIANMQQALDEQAVENMVENLTQEVLGDSLEVRATRKQGRVPS